MMYAVFRIRPGTGDPVANVILKSWQISASRLESLGASRGRWALDGLTRTFVTRKQPLIFNMDCAC